MLRARRGLLPLGYARATRHLVPRRVVAVDRLDPAAHAFDHALQRGVDCDALVERAGQLRLASSTSFWISLDIFGLASRWKREIYYAPNQGRLMCRLCAIKEAFFNANDANKANAAKNSRHLLHSRNSR